MDIGELNSRVTINSYTVTQNETTGRAESSLNSSWIRWAKVVQNTNNRTLENMAVSFKEAYTITKRFETDKPTLNNYVLVFGGKTLTIGSVVKKEVGKVWFEEITAYTRQ